MPSRLIRTCLSNSSFIILMGSKLEMAVNWRWGCQRQEFWCGFMMLVKIVMILQIYQWNISKIRSTVRVYLMVIITGGLNNIPLGQLYVTGVYMVTLILTMNIKFKKYTTLWIASVSWIMTMHWAQEWIQEVQNTTQGICQGRLKMHWAQVWSWVFLNIT